MGRDKEILRVAQQLFYERGFDAVGIDEVGEAAGITGPAIYRHFNGKDEILGTLFEEAVGQLLMRIGNEPLDDPIEEMTFLTREHARFVIDHQELTSILIRDDRSLAEPFRRRHQRRERPYIERWFNCLSAAFPDREKDELRSALFAALHLLNSVGAWPREARRSENLAELLADMTMGALLALGDVSPVETVKRTS